MKRTQEYEISEESALARERQERAMQSLLTKRRASAMVVPTNDNAVRARLRSLGEPVIQFGEGEMERRDRLRMVLTKFDSAHKEDESSAAAAAADSDDQTIQYPFYTAGSRTFLDARLNHILNYSMVGAASRLERARRKENDPDEDVDAEMNCALEQALYMKLDCSEIGDNRPLSGCSFSHDGKLLATCSLSPVANLWSMPQVTNVASLKGHTDRLTDVTFSPAHNNLLVTASADRTARLWNSEGAQLMTFEGHLDRLARIAFHPSGKYLGTASFDRTWRLWDVETNEELLLQEGHSRPVYGINFHRDGSLVATSGFDALARVWDLRIARSILALKGHHKKVLAPSFSANGYYLATGGEDNTCKIWDLRKRKSLYTVGHFKLISQVKFKPQEGHFVGDWFI